MKPGDSESSLRHALEEITAQSTNVPEYELIGFFKGAALNYAGLSQPDRAALLNLLIRAGSAARPAVPGNVYVSQNQSVSQNQNAQPRVTIDNSGAKRESAARAWGLSLLAAAAVIGGAVITARCSRKPEEPAAQSTFTPAAPKGARTTPLGTTKSR